MIPSPSSQAPIRLRRLPDRVATTRPIDAAEVFALYERNWHFVDRDKLTTREAMLIDELGEEFGHGFKLM